MKMVARVEYDELIAARAERDRLHALINTVELVDFPKAVLLESAHQEERWGTTDREGKTPYDWHWLVAHLAGRALSHHKEAERIEAMLVKSGFTHSQIAYHREKAVHHCITTAAALSHWHASMLGKHTNMRAGHVPNGSMPELADGGILDGSNRTTSGAIGQP